MNVHRQRGFSLVTAIFIITVLASLGAFLLVMSGVAQQTPVMGYQGAQAYHAARSGLEWGIDRAINGAGACNGSFAIGNYNVVVACASTTHPDGPVSAEIFVVNAVATRGTPGQLGYARREVEGVVSPVGPQ